MRLHPGIALAVAAATGLLPASPAPAEITPDWIVEIPLGTALGAGLQGMVTDAAGVTYITGINGPSSNTDIITLAVGPDGTILWQDVFNGSADWHDQSRDIALGPGGIVYVTGNTPGAGNYSNVLLLKYDGATGTRLDTMQYSSAPFTSEHGATLATDPQRNVYVGAGTVGDSADGMLLSFDSPGQLRWMTMYDGPASAPYSQDHIEQVEIGPDGNLVAMIHGVMGTLHPDYVVIKYDAADGSVIWQANWGVFGGDFPRDMEIDAAGDVYVTGTGIDVIDKYSTIKLRGTDGQLLWQEYDAIGGDDSARALALDGAGGVYVTGVSDPDGNLSNFNGNFYTVKRDATSGAQLWTHFYGADCVGCSDVPGDVIVDSAGNVLVVGGTSSPPYSNDLIMFVLDAGTGIEIDRSVLDAPPGESVGGAILRFDADENVYVGGGYSNADTGTVDMAIFKYLAPSGLDTCPSDANGDLQVNVTDLLEVLATWGACSGCVTDADASGTVDTGDLLMVLANWGPCP